MFSDLYGAFDPAVAYWGPASAAWGAAERGLTQNMGQLYIGAMPVALGPHLWPGAPARI